MPATPCPIDGGGATLGLLLWIGLRVSGKEEGRGLVALLGLSLATIVGAILHCYNPPPFTHAWLGPWIAIPSAAFAGCAAVWNLVARTPSNGRDGNLP